MNALILAGSKNNGKLSRCSAVANEALIPIGEKTMLEYVVAAVKQSAYIDQIVIAGPTEYFQPLFDGEPGIVFAPAGETAIQGVLNCLKLLDKNEKILVATSDIPLITPEAIDMFIAACLRDGKSDLYYPIVPKEVNDLQFPGVRRTYVNLRDGVFTGGNLFLVNPEIVPKCANKAEEIVSLRKSPLSLAKLIGAGFIIKFLLRLITISEAEKRVSILLGVSSKAIVSLYPEVGVDVDKPSDLELVRKVLQS